MALWAWWQRLRRVVGGIGLALALLAAGHAAAEGPAPATPSVPADPAVDALVTKIQAKYAPVTTLSATFTQKAGSLYGEETQQGTLALQRPGKMRWTFADGRQFVCDGQTLWVYTPADKTVLKLTGVSQQAASADAVLQSLHELRTRFDVLGAVSTATNHTLTLQPKSAEDAQFKKLVLVLDAKLLLDEVRLTDAFDTVTTLDFTEVTLGGAIPPKTFTFDVPPGVQVVQGN